MTNPPDAIIAPAWLAINFALGWSLWRFAAIVFPRETARQLAFHTLTLSWMVITLVSIAMGSTGLLARFAHMLGVTALIAALAVLGVLRRLAGRPGLRHPVISPLPSLTNPRNLALLLLASGLVGHTLIDGFAGFVNDWDSLMYHIPLVDQWIHAGSLYAPDCYHWSCPGGNELIGFWMMAPFSGDFFGPLNNLPGTALLLLGVLELAPRLGLTPRFAGVTAAASVANFVVLDQLISAGNDVAVTALFVATTAYGLRFRESGRLADMLLCGGSLGILAGIKYYALGYAAVAWGVCIWSVARGRGRLAGCQFAVASLLLAIVVGGYWYVRNAVATGSPLFPLGVSQINVNFDEREHGIWASTLLGCRRPEAIALGIRAIWNMTGPCHLAAVLGLPFSITWLVVTGFRASHRGRLDTRTTMVTLLLAAMMVFSITPLCLEDEPGTLNQLTRGYTPVRYGLTPLTMALFGLSTLLQDVSHRIGCVSGRTAASDWRRVASLAPAWAMGVASIAQLVFTDATLRFDRLACMLFAINILGVAFVLRRVGPRVRTACAVTACICASVSTWVVSNNWMSGFDKSYQRYSDTEIYSHVRGVGVGAKICLLDYLSHPYFGPKRLTRVCQPPDIPSVEWLLEYIKSHECNLVVVHSRPVSNPSKKDPFRIVLTWLDEPGRQSRLLYRDHAYSLYRMSDSSPNVTSPRPVSSGRSGGKTFQGYESLPLSLSPVPTGGSHEAFTRSGRD